jgi:hypothetical protein
MGIAVRLMVYSALALMSASARAQQPAVDATKFHAALSCRLSTISGGQRNTAAVYENTPNPIEPLRLVRINAGSAGSELEVITPQRNQLIVGHTGIVRDLFYWTPNDDLVVWMSFAFLHLPTRGLSAGSSPRFRIIWAGGAALQFWPEEGDVIPEHIRTTARAVGKIGDREPIQFEVATGGVSYLPVPVGPFSATAWTEDDEFVRLRTDYNTWRWYLDVFEPATSEWIPLTRAAMPRDSVLVAVRNNPANKDLEAVIRWREQGVDKIGVVKRGALKPQVIASDKALQRVLVSPDRSRIYGFVDGFGRFRRVGTESQKPGVAFWLTQLEKRQGLEQVYFLSDAKFALIKANGPVAGPEMQLLERRENAVAVRRTFCTRTDVDRVAEGEHSILFVPKGADSRKLIVYLHDGPSARVGRGGNWLIDLLLASGHPVIAVNYTGSIGREREANDDRSWGNVFGDEIARAVTFARGDLGAREPAVVLVGEGFGSLVGFSALSLQKIALSGFVSVSGLVSSDHLLSQLQSQSDTAFGNYGRTARETRTALDPSKIRASHPQLDFLFVHGDKDERAPYGNIVKFAEPLTVAGRPAVVIMREMYHPQPHLRAHYDGILEAISDFLSRR